MIKGATSSGFEYEIEEDRLENFELIDVLAEVDENPLLLSKVLELLLGSEQKKALYDHVRKENRTVPVQSVVKEIEDMFDGCKQIKNFVSSRE